MLNVTLFSSVHCYFVWIQIVDCEDRIASLVRELATSDVEKGELKEEVHTEKRGVFWVHLFCCTLQMCEGYNNSYNRPVVSVIHLEVLLLQ